MTRIQAMRRGQATVEFALVGTVFFLLMFGVFEVSRLTYGYNAVSNGSREGARWAVATVNNPNPGAGTTKCVTGNAGLNAAAQAQLRGIAPITITATEDSTVPPAWCQVTIDWAFTPLTGNLDHFVSFHVKTTSRQLYN